MMRAKIRESPIKTTHRLNLLVLVLAAAAYALPASAQDAAELAKKLSNPVAALISVPLQFNADMNYGPDDAGEKVVLNIQPVIPTSISEKWNLISRIITPIIAVDDIFPGSGGELGLGDMTPTFFFSPKEPTKGGLIWGAGPVFLLPTATDDLLGADQWGMGPSFLVLKQQSGWTVGMLVNHIEHVAGDDRLPDISTSFMQPFVSKAWPSGLSITLNTESTYDWNNEQWTVPVNLQMAGITKMGTQLIQLFSGLRYYAEAPENGPEWGIRLGVTLLYPKK
jgi:hypothetical protein